MANGVLEVVIDERKQDIDDLSFLSMGNDVFVTNQKVFKDYILSSEVFTLN